MATDTTGLRRSGRETLSRKQSTASPSNMRKSERLEKRPPTTPNEKKKRVPVDDQVVIHSLRRSDRGKKQASSSSSGSKKSMKGSIPSNMKKTAKTKRSLKKARDSSEVGRSEKDVKLQGMEWKVVNGHSYKASFKQQKIRLFETDNDDKELERVDMLPEVNSSRSSNRGNDVELDRPDDGSSSKLREEKSDDRISGQLVEGTLDYSERVVVDGILADLDPPKLLCEISPDGESINDGSGDMEKNHECLSSKRKMGADGSSPFSICEKQDSDEPSVTLSKKRRKEQNLEKQQGLDSCKTSIRDHHNTTVHAAKESFVEQKLPFGCPPGVDINHLTYANKLHEWWSRGQCFIVCDDQERFIRVILFILSLKAMPEPFLIVTTSSSVSLWEAEFSRLSASTNIVIYSGDKETQSSVRMLEICGEGGQVTLRVQISNVESIVLQDSSMSQRITWAAVIVDECQRSEISSCLKQIKTVPSSARMLLFCGPAEDIVAKYADIFPLLSCDVTVENNFGKMKEYLSKFVAYDCVDRKSESSRFVEYWVPAEISNVQLEQYCATLLSSSIALCSSSKNDPVGALRDILISTRKCCDHPYIVNESISSMITKDLDVTEYLDVGIKASGKLLVLDMILSEMKKQNLRVLVLFQSITGGGRDPICIGDILDDFLRQRFGPDSYEHVAGSGLVPSKRQAILNNFNKKEKGRFVFLLENRACSYSIKLSDIDAIVIYGSDWNPANDIRALQKIQIDCHSEPLKLFRLYTSCTVEERILAEREQILDSNLQSISRSKNNDILMWGASYLFSKLHESHSASDAEVSSGQSFMNNLAKEFSDLLHNCNSHGTDNSVITRVQQSATLGTYRRNLSLLGELKVQSVNGEQPQVFWKKLLDGRNPRWKYLSVLTPRQRKRAQTFDEASIKIDTGNADLGKKRKKMVDNCIDVVASKPVLEGDGKEGSDEVASGIPANFKAQTSPNDSSRQTKANMETTFSNQQKSLLLVLRSDVSRLCETLKLPEDVKVMVGRFLEYVIENRRVNREPATILQAFLISLCWIGASILKRKIDRNESLALAKKHLNFSCKVEEADSVYSKLVELKNKFLSQPDNIREPVSVDFQGLEARIENPKRIKRCQRKSEKRIAKLLERFEAEIEGLKKEWEEKRRDLETDYKLEKAFISTLHHNAAMRLDKFEKLDHDFAKKMEVHNQKREISLEELKARQLDAMKQLEARCLAIQNPSAPECRAQNGLPLHERQDRMQVGSSDVSVHVTERGSENVTPLSEYPFEEKFPDKNFHGSQEANQLTSFETSNHDTQSGSKNIPTLSLDLLKEGVGHKTQSTKQVEFYVASEHGTQKRLDSESPVIRDLVEEQRCDEVVNDLYLAVSMNNSVTVPLVSNYKHTEVDHADSEDFSAPKGADSSSNGTGNILSTGPNHSVIEKVPIEGHVTVANGVVGPSVILELEAPASDVVGPNETVGLEAQSVDNNEQTLRNTSDADMADTVEERRDETNVSISSNLISAAPSLKKLVPPVVSSTSHPLSPQNAEVQKECPQPSPCSDRRDAEVQNSMSVASVAPLHPMDSEQKDQSNSEDPFVERLEEPSLPLSDDPPLAYDQNKLPLASLGHETPCEERTVPSSDSGQPPSVGPVTPCEAQTVPHDSVQPQAADSPSYFPSHGISQDGGDTLAAEESPQSEGLPGSSLAGGVGRQSSGELHHSSLHAERQSVIQPGHTFSTHGSGSQNQVVSRLPNQPSSQAADPLQYELERLNEEKDHLNMFHEDMKQRLKADCEKEIADMIAQIKSKYEAKRQDEEAAFLVKKKEIETNLTMVIMNKILADAFKSKCIDLSSSGAIRMQQAVPPSIMQQMYYSPQPAQRPPALVSSSSANQTSASPSVATQPPPLQNVSQPAALFSSPPPRPPTINTISSSGNVRLRPAPHIQPFRSSASVSPPVAPAPHIQPFRPSVPPSSSPAPHIRPVRPPASVAASSPSPFQQNSNIHQAQTTRPPSSHALPEVSFQPPPPAPPPQPSKVNDSAIWIQHTPSGLPATSSSSAQPSPRQLPTLQFQLPPLPQVSRSNSGLYSRPPQPETSLSGLPATTSLISRPSSQQLQQPTHLTLPPPMFSNSSHLPQSPLPENARESLPATTSSISQPTSRQLPPQPTTLPPVSTSSSGHLSRSPHPESPGNSTPTTTSTNTQPSSRQLPQQPASLPTLPQLSTSNSGLYGRPPQIESGVPRPSPPSASVNMSALELLMDMDNRANRHHSNTVPPPQDSNTKLESSKQSVTETPSAGGASNVVCLSDDE